MARSVAQPAPRLTASQIAASQSATAASAVTPNALLYALDQSNGRLVWKTSLGDPLFLSESVAPIFFDGKLFVGSAGSEAGQRGFEAAYDGRTGKQIWRHYTIPPANTPGSWVKGHHGGGTVWMNPALDPHGGR